MQPILDRCSVVISGVCVIHCLALPPLLILFPLLGGTVLTDELFHVMLLWIIIPTSVVAIAMARRHHPDSLVLVLVGIGIMVLLVGAFWAHDHAAAWVDTALSIMGSGLLASGHIRNFRLCRH